ncbi:uncharacterized protein LOC106436306 [Brassica napus]|uniref:uncharacterized protein LOC106436306 n=1 Tax=Brassica napus TaxID=3708 RepID=UPI0020789870|nr:uncharacterized protein LOC106436306 [Brassica napus]
MDSNGSVVIHFEHGVDRHISTLVMKGRYEEITYSHLVDRIGKKLKIDVDATKLQLSYFPLVLNNKNSCYILNDEDVLGYLMMVDKKNRRCVLHVELAKIVSENQSNEMFSMNEENLSDARANDGIVEVGELEIVPHIQEDEFEHEKISEEGDEMDDREELPAVTAVEPPVVNSEWDDGIDISLHQEFATREEVRDLVDKGVHSNCFEVDIQKSNPRVYILKCRGAGCISVMKKKKRGTPSLVASVVHSDYPGKYKTPDPKTLIDLVQNKLGVKVSYSTALRGKNKALSDLRGNPEESFARLPSYLYMLQRMNPDTITRLEVDEKNQFKYMFFALGACIEGFKAMRQVIIMDGTHLKGVYKGVLLIATAQDPDHHHYPLAFAVVDGEKNASWEWFLTILKTLIPNDPQLVFCTDRNQSIIKKVHEVYPLAIHGYCNYHLSNNVSGACSNVNKKGVAKKFSSIAGIYSEVEFIKCYNDFRKMYPQAAEYLDDSVHETKWARCKFPGERYNIDTTNTVESINGVLKEPRKYALLPMLDVIVEKITEWFNKYRLLSLRVPERQILIPHVHGILHHIYPSAKKLKVTELNTFEGHYNVLGEDDHGYLVDLSNKTCYCRCFDIDRYPCVHALAAIMARGEMAEHYCSRLSSLRMWRKKKGRLQVTRFPSAGEYRRKRKKKFPPLIGENEESGSDGTDSDSSGSDSSDSSGNENE